MNILLTTPAAPIMSPFFTAEKRMPLGIGFLISVLRNAGHNVFFIDNYLNPNDFLETDFLVKNKIDYVGISVNTICYRDAHQMFHKLEMLRKLKKWNGKIITGGPHTSVALDTIPDFVDYIIQGEGEIAILDVLKGNTSRIVRAERIKNLDSLPRPAYDYFANLPYDFSVQWFPDKPVFSMNTSRGCPFNCTFCSVGAVWGKKYTFFSAEWLVSEIQYLIKTYGVKGVYFREDNFTANQKRVIEFCNLLMKKNVKIKWACETRVDTLDKDLIKVMHDAGCRAFYIGVESGNQRVLDFLKKGITLEQVRRVFKWCREIGIKTWASFIVGIPTETMKERLDTICFAKEIKPTNSGFNIFVGIPGSELYNYAVENKLYKYIDDRGLLYLKNHDELVNQFYVGIETAKIPSGRNQDGFIKSIQPKRPKVSVIMTVYNGEKYVREAIDSILNQTFQDFEFIIVDDGSKDRTEEILKSYKDKRIKLLFQEVNRGQANSRNRAIKIAKGEYIASMDDDDISLPQRLKLEVAFLEKYQDIGLVGSGVYHIDKNGKILDTQFTLTDNEQIQKKLIEHNCFYHSSVMIRKETLDKVGYYREQFKYALDYDLFLRVAEHYKVDNLPEVLCKWRLHENGITVNKKDEQERYAVLARQEAQHRKLGNNVSKDSTVVIESPEKIEISTLARIKRRRIAKFYKVYGLSYLVENKPSQARERFFTSLKYNPFAFEIPLYLFLTFLSPRIIHFLRTLKQMSKTLIEGEKWTNKK